MSIRGSVRCRCIETGRALPPPVALKFDERGRLRPADVLAARWEAFWAWRRSACEHPDMNVFDGTLSWYNVRLLREALDDEATSYPVLLESIPTWNGHWWLTPDEAVQALGELQYFRDRHREVAVDRLLEADSGGVLAATPRGRREWFWSLGAGLAGLSGHGTLCVWTRDPHLRTPLFEAGRCQQRILSRNPEGKPARAEFRDPTTGATLTMPAAVGTRHGGPRTYPSELMVVEAVASVTEAYPALTFMTELFKASIATGNPAEWG
jgi:hypothetical protein